MIFSHENHAATGTLYGILLVMVLYLATAAALVRDFVTVPAAGTSAQSVPVAGNAVERPIAG